MESYLSKNSKCALDMIVEYIRSSDEYLKCIELKKKMQSDKELLSLIEEVKEIQKKYIRSNYDDFVKSELDSKLDILNSNSLYVLYNYYLDKVNEMFNFVSDELNEYFSGVVKYDF